MDEELTARGNFQEGGYEDGFPMGHDLSSIFNPSCPRSTIVVRTTLSSSMLLVKSSVESQLIIALSTMALSPE